MYYKTLTETVDRWWNDVCSHAKSGCVFIDDAAAESLHWHGGLTRMLDAGALCVKNFSPFEKSEEKKAVFVLTYVIDDEVLKTLENIIRASEFKSCTIVLSSPERCHSLSRSETYHKSLFALLENLCLQWMGSMNYYVEVLYIPLLVACVSSRAFVLPFFSKVFSPLSSFHQNWSPEKKTGESGVKILPDSMKISMMALVHFLHSLFESLHIRADIFSLGHLSHIIGSELENLCYATKRKTFSSKASVLLIDRALDLAGPLSQATETFFDKMLRVLPHLPGHTVDVSVKMSKLISAPSGTVFGRPLVAPGCLAHKSTSTEVAVLDAIICKKQKEALMEVNRRLVEVTSKEKIAIDVTGRVTAKVLTQRALAFRSSSVLMLKHSGLLQQVLAVCEALESNTNSYFDNLLGMEKLLVQNLSLSEDVSDNVVNLISHRKDNGFKLEDILTLIAFLHVLAGKGVFKDEINESVAQASIVEALFDDDEQMQQFASEFVGDLLDDQSMLSAVKSFFATMKTISSARKDLKKYKSVFQSGDPALPAVYVPLLRQILQDIFNPSVNELPDVEFHSAGLRDLIKTGFSLFMNVARPRPRDNPLLIILFVGGVTASELKLIHEISSRQKETEIIVGSTSILTPASVMSDIKDVVTCARQNRYKVEE